MPQKRTPSTTQAVLRKQAEKRLQTTRRDIAAMPLKNIQKLVHELQVHQIELEMQNEELRRTQMELETARDRYAGLYDFAPVGYLTLDLHGEIMEANLVACTLLGVNRKDVKRQRLTRFIAPEDVDTFHRLSQDVSKAGTRQTAQIRLRDTIGNMRWMHFEGIAIADEGARLIHWRTAFLDISAQKNAEHDLQHANESFTHAVLNSIPAQVCVLNCAGVIVRSNDAWQAAAAQLRPNGLSVGEVGQNYLDLCQRAIAGGESNAQAFLSGVRSVLTGSQPSCSAEYSCTSSEETLWFLIRANPLKEVRGVVLSSVDISERVRMQQGIEQSVLRLRESEERLKFLSAKLIVAQDQERKRIARDLHDDISQQLAVLVLDLSSLEQQPPLMPELVTTAVEPIRKQLEQLSDDIHSIARKLHPSLLEHAGLLPALEDHIHHVSTRTGLSIILKVRKIPDLLPLDQATCLFRVLQESLQNIVKHANATAVLVKVSRSSKGIGLSVTDNGTGFDAGDTSGPQQGLGLISMQERLRQLDGLFRVHCRPAVGTKVSAWIPFVENES